jgi:hypothetical protein
MKITRGGVLENPPQFDFPDELSDRVQDEFKPIRGLCGDQSCRNHTNNRR